MNKYHCTITGKSYSEATIQANLGKAYKEFYMFEPLGACEGCGNTATNTAHILPKATLKSLKITSLIWSPELWFRSCIDCNLAAENPYGSKIKSLKNFDTILSVTKKYDPIRYNKMMLNEN